MYSLFSCYLRGMLWVFKLFLQYHNIIFLIRKPTNMAKRLLVSGDSLVHSHPQFFLHDHLQYKMGTLKFQHFTLNLTFALSYLAFAACQLHIFSMSDVEWLTANQCPPGNWLSFGYACDQHTKHIKPVQKHEMVNMQSKVMMHSYSYSTYLCQ